MLGSNPNGAGSSGEVGFLFSFYLRIPTEPRQVKREHTYPCTCCSGVGDPVYAFSVEYVPFQPFYVLTRSGRRASCVE